MYSLTSKGERKHTYVSWKFDSFLIGPRILIPRLVESPTNPFLSISVSLYKIRSSVTYHTMQLV